VPAQPELDTWSAAFEAFHARFAPHFARREARGRSARYLRGLLGPVERKNGWQLAEAAGERDPQGMQRLLRTAVWDADAVRDELLRFAAERLGAEDGALILDETGFLKKGRHSVGVKRQYSGTAGRVENCQVGVFLGYAAARGQALVDRALYLPAEWAADPERRAAARVPESVGFRTKPELGWELVQRAHAAGLPFRWVLGDTVYGQDPGLRARLAAFAPAAHYLLAVPATTRAWTRPARAEGRAAERVRLAWEGQTAAGLAAALPAAAWRRLSAGAGAKGPRLYDWAAVRVALGEDGWPGPEGWLLARRSVADPTELAYYLSNAPADMPLEELVGAAGRRWAVEQCFEEAKGEAGLDHYEARSWTGWHRHVTLSLLALTFLATLRAGEAGGKWGGADRPERAGGAATPGDRPTVDAPLGRGAAGLVAVAAAPSGGRPPRPLHTQTRPLASRPAAHLTL
jgi:SRSO17 transposase